jgi:hypothetical protein
VNIGLALAPSQDNMATNSIMIINRFRDNSGNYLVRENGNLCPLWRSITSGRWELNGEQVGVLLCRPVISHIEAESKLTRVVLDSLVASHYSKGHCSTIETVLSRSTISFTARRRVKVSVRCFVVSTR